jgi:diguanylate cyclase (GGDEF)-like protein
MDSYLKQITILYVEDDDIVREAYKRTLKRLSKKLFIACDGVEGIELYKKHRPDIIISDIKMPNKNGIEMAKEIKNINPNQIILFTTAHTESGFTLEALDLQVDGYITKPVDKKRLRSKLTALAKNIVNERENIKKSKILQNILDNQSGITVLTDFTTIEFASASFFNLFGVKNKEEFFNRFGGVFDVFIPHKDYLYGKTKSEFLDRYNSAKDEKKVVSIAGVDGVKAFYVNIDPIGIDTDTLYIISLTDITYLQEEKLKIQYKATHDELTGSYNRVKFDELFEVEYLRSLRYQRPLSIAILDIDHFKIVNDTHGHLVGDEILKKLVKYCKSNIRKTDFFARWGGEEFVLLMSETDIDKGKEVCEHLREGIEQMNFSNLPKITISIGATQMRFDDTKETLFKRTDEALYEAKKSGRNRVVVW